MGTKYRGKESARLALDTYIKLIRSVNTLLAAVRRDSPLPEGMSQSQFEVLEALLHCGPLCQREVSHKILKSTGNITMVVDHLERDGLVQRTTDASDRRMTIVALTPEGQRKIEEYFPVHAGAIAASMASLSESEQKNLGELCKKLGLGIRSKLTRTGGIP